MELKQTYKVVSVQPKFNSEAIQLEPVNPDGKFVQELPGNGLALINGNAAKLNALKVDSLVEVTVATKELTEQEQKEAANPSASIQNVEDTPQNLANKEPGGALDSTIVDEPPEAEEDEEEPTEENAKPEEEA